MNNMNRLAEFYKEKKVLLTGHTGFKGTWMSIVLEMFGAEVCGYSLPLSEYSFFHKVSPKVKYHIEGDIADENKVFRTIDTFQPEIIFHFASHSSLDGSMKIPDFILRTNLMGVVNVLESARKTGSVKSMVIVTSDKCYQNCETDGAYTEDSPLGAKDPYSTSKVCQELLTSCYMDTFFDREEHSIGTATARASNVIGAGDYNVSRLMPYLLDCFLNSRVAQIRNPHAVRPWQYVLDVLYGYLLLAEKLYRAAGKTIEFNGAYNFGPGEDGFISVSDMAEMLKLCFEDASYEVQPGYDRIRKESKILKLNSDKARKVLAWVPHYKIEEMIKETACFSIQEKQGECTKALCKEAVQKYLERVND